MSCCEDDPLGPECHQGRDCPVRKKMMEEGQYQENVVGVLMALAACICAVALIILFWRS